MRSMLILTLALIAGLTACSPDNPPASPSPAVPLTETDTSAQSPTDSPAVREFANYSESRCQSQDR